MTEAEKKAQSQLIAIAAQQTCAKQGITDPIAFSSCIAKEIQKGNDAARTDKINDFFKNVGGKFNEVIEQEGGILNALDRFSNIVAKLKGAGYSPDANMPNLDLSKTCGEGEVFNAEKMTCEKTKSKAWIWIIVAVVAILLIVGTILIIRANRKNKK